MKVLLIAHSCQVRHEGQQRAQPLGRLPGVDLRVIAPDRWLEPNGWRTAQTPTNPSYHFQVEPVRFPWAGPAQWYLHYYPRLAKTLRTFRPDIIDIWEEAWGLVSAHTCWLRNRLLPSAKILSETEANIPRTHPFPFKQFRAYTLRNTDYAVARQTEGVEVLRAKGYTGPVEVIGNAVDADLFRPLDKEACKRALGIAGFVVGYVGRLIEAKGLMDIVEALPLCPSDLKLIFVGTGPFKETLQTQVARLKLVTRVHFMPPCKMENLPQIMNAIDALLLPSRTTKTWKEQFGRVIIEAQACRTPVIGSDSGAIPEVIGQGGLVVREGNVDELAAAIRRLQENPALCLEMGQLGRQHVENLYTWKRVSERMRDIYEKMLQEPRSTTSSYSAASTLLTVA